MVLNVVVKETSVPAGFAVFTTSFAEPISGQR
jgi:hypothetical protein